jgi:hypothetical protein
VLNNNYFAPSKVEPGDQSSKPPISNVDFTQNKMQNTVTRTMVAGAIDQYNTLITFICSDQTPDLDLRIFVINSPVAALNRPTLSVHAGSFHCYLITIFNKQTAQQP